MKIMYNNVKQGLRKYGLQALVLGGLALGNSSCSVVMETSQESFYNQKPLTEEEERKESSKIYSKLFLASIGLAFLVDKYVKRKNEN